MNRVLVLLWVTVISLAATGPPATLLVKDKQSPAELKDKVLHMQATSFMTQTISSDHTLIRVVLANPISGCSALDHLNFTAQMYPTYYLIEGREGDCTYARKVQLARKALARGVIIIDSAKGTNNLNPRLNRHNFQIFLMDEADGDFLVTAIKEKHSFVAQLYIGNAEEKAQAQVWVSSLNKRAYEVMGWWETTLGAIPKLEDKLEWRPRFAYIACNGGANCGGQYVSSCACGGDFCSPEVHGKTSDVVVREDIRQTIIFKDHPDKFLAYVRHFKEKCLANYIVTNFAEDCASRVLLELDIEPSGISERVDNFLLECSQGEGEPIQLYEQLTLDRGKLRAIGHYPTILVNHEEVTTTSQNDLKGALCRKLGLDQEEGCSEAYTVTQIFSKVVTGIFWVVLVIILVGTGVIVVIFFRNRLRKQMNKQLRMQVSTAVEHYFQLSQSTVAK